MLACPGGVLVELPLDFALDFCGEGHLGEIRRDRDPRVAQVERHSAKLGVDVMGQSRAELENAGGLHLLQDFGELFRALLAEDRDLLRDYPQLQVAFVVAPVLFLRLDGIIAGLGAAFEHQLVAFQFRVGQNIVSGTFVRDGQFLRSALHDVVGQNHRVFRFFVPAVFEPQHVRRLAEEHGIVLDLSKEIVFDLLIHTVYIIVRSGIPMFLPLVQIAFQLELDVMRGGRIIETDSSAIEILFRTAEIDHDIRQRLFIHFSDRSGKGVLPARHVEMAILVVERAVRDGNHLAIAEVTGPGGIIGEIFYGGGKRSVFVV